MTQQLGQPANHAPPRQMEAATTRTPRVGVDCGDVKKEPQPNEADAVLKAPAGAWGY
jgi:hypothetical protein